MSETWKDIPGWGGRYQASDAGRVRSVTRRTAKRLYIGRVLKWNPNADGYARINLSRDGKAEKRSIHELVLLTFIGPCPLGLEGCHGDGDSNNNSLSNLRWDTRSANMRDKVRHGTHHQANKTHCPQGHPYDGVNARGERFCHACAAAQMRKCRAHDNRSIT